MGCTIRTECSSHDRVAIISQYPVEGDVVLQIQEVVAVNYSKFIAFNACDKGTGIVMLKFVIVGEGCAVGIEQAVGTLISIHLEAALV